LLEAIERSQPDVLITDVRMPGMSGLALLTQLRRDYPDLPVIVMTAHSDLDNAVAAYHGGAFEYLPKPFDLDETMALVQKAARQNGRKAEWPGRSRTKPWDGSGPSRADRQGPGNAGGVSLDRAAGPLQHDGAHYRRVGYRQGTRRTRVAPAQPAGR
jgi:DNA-binding response OmpR family regulator